MTFLRFVVDSSTVFVTIQWLQKGKRIFGSFLWTSLILFMEEILHQLISCSVYLTIYKVLHILVQDSVHQQYEVPVLHHLIMPKQVAARMECRDILHVLKNAIETPKSMKENLEHLHFPSTFSWLSAPSSFFEKISIAPTTFIKANFPLPITFSP